MTDRTEDELATTARFAAEYRAAGADVIREIERATCGCDYGATSWATRAEADRVGRLLGLAPGTRLLDIGSGSGWPALYLARTTGCEAALTDLPPDALRQAASRAAADGIAGACLFAVADAAALPFADARFDAVSHSDVLCCLSAKAAALAECRRVLAPGGTMAFSVISIVPGLSPRQHAKAATLGPPFVAADAPYPELLARTGWRVVERTDVTAGFRAMLHAVYARETAQADALRAVIGAEALADKRGRRERAIAGVEAGLLQRELIVARPA